MPFLRFHFYRVGSTHQKARELLNDGVRPPFVVQAELQEAGRGRYGRTWYSPPGGLWFTVVFPATPPERFVRVTVFAAEAVARVLETARVREVRIKVPNDLVLQGRKIGGVLGEWDPRAALLGIGLNTRVRGFPEEVRARAGSVEQLGGVALKHPELLQRILDHLNALYEAVLQERDQSWYQAWHRRLLGLGKRVRFGYPPLGQTIKGIFEGVTPRFELRVDGALYDLAQVKDFREVPGD